MQEWLLSLHLLHIVLEILTIGIREGKKITNSRKWKGRKSVILSDYVIVHLQQSNLLGLILLSRWSAVARTVASIPRLYITKAPKAYSGNTQISFRSGRGKEIPCIEPEPTFKEKSIDFFSYQVTRANRSEARWPRGGTTGLQLPVNEMQRARGLHTSKKGADSFWWDWWYSENSPGKEPKQGESRWGRVNRDKAGHVLTWNVQLAQRVKDFTPLVLHFRPCAYLIPPATHSP
ncbi:hypothetical protein AAY473_012303 [Plecturocebus cupreus]